jgi:large subunit ribosomal protein L9
MRVILCEEIQSLGSIGEIVNVKDGYARNFLFPRSLAVVANEGNTRQLNHQKRVLNNRKEKLLAELREVAKRIAKVSLTITKQIGEEGRIFGTVTTQEIVEALAQQGVEVSRKKVRIADAINKIGSYTAEIKLHADVVAELKFTVVAPEAPAAEAAAAAE